MNSYEKLKYLIQYLLNENDYVTEIPASFDQAFALYRALVNSRLPNPISDEYLEIEDSFLQDLNSKKLVAHSSSLPFIEKGISLWKGDITTIESDAIVNAANDRMLGCFVPGHHCIDNAINTFAGVRLRLYCNDMMIKQGELEKTGRAKITPGFNLPAKHILHTVGPIVTTELQPHQEDELASCYTSCLKLADENKLNSIVFCCISTGVFGFPAEKAADIAVKTVRSFLDSSPKYINHVIFNVFSDKDWRLYNELLG